MIGRRARIALTGVLAVVALIALPTRTEAVPLSFGCITDNSSVCGSLEGAYTVDVALLGSDVAFTFGNLGHATLDTGVIAQIYFDAPAGLFGTMSIYDDDNTPGAGTNFSPGGSPGNLPAGNPISFTSDHRGSANNPAPQNGVNVGDFLRIAFALNGGATLQTVLDAFTSGTLRIGLHVISIGEFSESLVNDPYSPPTTPTPVPEPASLILFGTGLAGIAGMARRRRAKA